MPVPKSNTRDQAELADGLTHAEIVKSCSPLTMPFGRSTYSPFPDSLTALPILPGTRGPVAPRVGDVGDRAGLRGRAGADLDLLAGGEAGRATEVDGGVARAGGGRQPRVGQAEQVVAVARELRPGRDGHRREDGLLGRVLGQGPVRQVDGAGAGVVELDERVGRVGAGAGAELVDLDRADVAHLLGRSSPTAARRVPGSSTRRCRPGRR